MSYCKDIGLDLSSIFLDTSVQFCNKINNGAVIQIFNFGKSKQMEYMKIVRKLGKIAGIENVNVEAYLSKIHRVVGADKKKRGNLREQYRKEEFEIPVYMDNMRMSAQRSAQSKDSEEKAEVKLSSLTEKLQERRTKVIELTEKTRKLERKEKRMEVY